MTSEDKPVQIPVLNGLVLAGGMSKRMGQDKGLMQWHGKPQRYYIADLLQNFCADVFISCRAAQETEMTGYKTIIDSYDLAGPIAGILSAFKQNSSAAWLVVACDMPLLDIATIKYLVNHRNEQSIATTFESPYDGLPEPLITIWEPLSFPMLLKYGADSITCPRKFLIRTAEKVQLLQPPNPDALMNTNTTADAEKVNAMLHKKEC